MKGIVILLGMIIVFAGFILICYSVSTKVQISYYEYITITVYPYQVVGAIILLIGFVTAVIGGYMPSISEEISEELREIKEEKEQAKLTEFSGETESIKAFESCGTCLFFRNPIMCLYKEKNAKARRCESYRPRK
jgi:uncharacterized membrane protein